VLGWWRARLIKRRRASSVGEGRRSVDGRRAVLDFVDPEGQRLALVDDGGARRGAAVGEEPGAGGAADPRPRPDRA
jgi:hypothetical protein